MISPGVDVDFKTSNDSIPCKTQYHTFCFIGIVLKFAKYRSITGIGVIIQKTAVEVCCTAVVFIM